MGKDKEVQIIMKLFTNLVEKQRERVGHLHDLFIQVQRVSGEVSLYGDDDELLDSCIIFSWINPEENNITASIRETLRECMTRLEQKGLWDNDCFSRPFSIELIDDNFDKLEELLFLDDDLVKLSEPLMKDMQRDLESFLNHLLEDLK